MKLDDLLGKQVFKRRGKVDTATRSYLQVCFSALLLVGSASTPSGSHPPARTGSAEGKTLQVAKMASHGAEETVRLKANIQDQLNRLLLQLQ
jgi:hypothetical protein